MTSRTMASDAKASADDLDRLVTVARELTTMSGTPMNHDVTTGKRTVTFTRTALPQVRYGVERFGLGLPSSRPVAEARFPASLVVVACSQKDIPGRTTGMPRERDDQPDEDSGIRCPR